MGSLGNAFETDLLELIFNNTNIAYLGDATGVQGSTSAGSIYVRLYTDAVVVDDATIGTECAYTGYAAKGVAVARTSGGWTVSGNGASNAAKVTFGACTAGSENVRYFALWLDNTNSTDAYRIAWGQLDSDLAVSAGHTPEFAIGELDVTVD